MNKKSIITALLAAALALTACSTQKEEAPQPLDDVMMQAFYWDVPVDEQAKNGSWWDHLREMAPELKAAGISSLWTPVPAKGNWGIVDSGYGIYDHYDLGNYDQKGTVETRYGSRASEAESIKGMMSCYIKRQHETNERSTTSAPQPTHEPVNIATTSSNKQNRPKP